MIYITNHKIKSFSSPKNPKEEERFFEFDEVSDHDNANINTTLTECNTYLGSHVKLINIPFSTYIKIDHFLKQPNFGHTVQQTINFIDKNGHNPDFETHQFNTTTYYHERPYGRLARSNVHAIMSLSDKSSKVLEKNKNYNQAITKPFDQNSNLQEMNDAFSIIGPSPIEMIQVPVILGEFDIDIILEENTLIDKGIVNVLEVSKEVVLTNCTFLPTSFTQSSDQTRRIASNGTLFVEGYLRESIEYLPAINREKLSPREWLKKIHYQIDQTIMIDLKIQLLQLQQVENHH